MQIKTRTLCLSLACLGWVYALPAAAEKSGADVYNKSCAVCHNIGVANAPKLGDEAAWTQRLAIAGKEGLYNTAIKGKGAMPPKGTCGVCSDLELKAAVDYLVDGK